MPPAGLFTGSSEAAAKRYVKLAEELIAVQHWLGALLTKVQLYSIGGRVGGIVGRVGDKVGMVDGDKVGVVVGRVGDDVDGGRVCAITQL